MNYVRVGVPKVDYGEYVVAATFSNIQHRYGKPSYFVAVAIDRDKVNDFAELRSKEVLVPNIEHLELQSNPFDLDQVEKELTRFDPLVIRGTPVEMPKKARKKFARPRDFVLEGYSRAILLLSSDIRFSSEQVVDCFLHIPLDENAQEIPNTALTLHSHPLSKYRPKFQRKGEFGRLLDYARLYSYAVYARVRRKLRPFIVGQIARNTSLNFLQLLAVRWNAPPVEEYADNFVGYPRLLWRTRTGTADTVLQPGVRLSMFPIARACVGLSRPNSEPICLNATAMNPFGAILEEGYELCSRCNKSARKPLRMYLKPKKEEAEGEETKLPPKSPIWYDSYSLYITLFGGSLKVGRSLTTRIVERMIEQGCADGVAFQGVVGYPLANQLEDDLWRFLKKNLSSFEVKGVEKVSEGISSETKSRQINKVSERFDQHARTLIYEEALKLINNASSPEMNYISTLDRRILDFRANWLLWSTKPDGREPVKEVEFVRFAGEVSGIVGNLLFLDDRLLDLKGLRGCIFDVRIN